MVVVPKRVVSRMALREVARTAHRRLVTAHRLARASRFVCRASFCTVLCFWYTDSMIVTVRVESVGVRHFGSLRWLAGTCDSR